MGKIKYLNKITELFKKSPIIDIGSIKRIINDKKKTSYSKLLIINLIKKGAIKRITNGYYTIHDDPTLAVFCFQPSYLGLQSSLSIYGLWDQETIPIILTTTKARVGIRKILESNVYIRRLEKRYFFGYSYMQDGKFYVPYSDIEKTLIDMIIFKEKINQETLKEINKKINKKKLDQYLKYYSKKTRSEILKVIS